jgi:hypothetical protein
MDRSTARQSNGTMRMTREKRFSRALITVLAAGLMLGGLAAGNNSRAEAGTTPPAMSWWGYWVGEKGNTTAGVKYIKRNVSKKFKTNVVLIHTRYENDNIAQITNALNNAKVQNIRVILMLDGLLRKPKGACAFGTCTGWWYNNDDYAVWRTKLQALATGIGDAKSAIVAIAGFDEINIANYGTITAAPSIPHPTPTSMQLIAEYFPTIPERGHVWKYGSAAPTAAMLSGSTLPFMYYYSDFLGPFTSKTVPFCPTEGTYPGRVPPAGSFLEKDELALSQFMNELNTAAGNTSTPVVYIPYSNRGYGRNGEEPPLVTSRGTACHLASLYQWLRCKAQTQPTTWAGQIRGIVAWQYDRLPPEKDATGAVVNPGWTGTKANAKLKQAGRWIGNERVTPTVPCS